MSMLAMVSYLVPITSNTTDVKNHPTRSYKVVESFMARKALAQHNLYNRLITRRKTVWEGYNSPCIVWFSLLILVSDPITTALDFLHFPRIRFIPLQLFSTVPNEGELLITVFCRYALMAIDERSLLAWEAVKERERERMIPIHSKPEAGLFETGTQLFCWSGWSKDFGLLWSGGHGQLQQPRRVRGWPHNPTHSEFAFTSLSFLLMFAAPYPLRSATTRTHIYAIYMCATKCWS